MKTTLCGSVGVGLGLVVMTVTASWGAGAGTSAGSILGMGVGARAIGMGEAYTAQADDISSLYWNPAGIALMNQSQASFLYNQWLQDLTHQTAAVGVPLENGGLGVSVSHLSYGDISGFDASGNPTGDVKAYSGVATLGAGWLGDSWALGFNAKGVQESLADVKATGFAGDLGGNWIVPYDRFSGTIRLGAVVRNLGTGLKFLNHRDPFPSDWRLGLGLVQMFNKRLNVALDYGKPRDGKGAIFGGVEYLPHPIIALRTGYAGVDVEGSPLRAGLGLRFKSMSFDYAYGGYGDLGMTHRYELSVKFAGVRPTLTPEQRRIYRQAKLAMGRQDYDKATLLFDSLIETQPSYRPFHRWVKRAMAGRERSELAAGKKTPTYGMPQLTPRSSKEDPMELQELEQLLNLSDPSFAKQLEGGQAKPKGEKQ